jgi:hypothetical protein
MSSPASTVSSTGPSVWRMALATSSLAIRPASSTRLTRPPRARLDGLGASVHPAGRLPHPPRPHHRLVPATSSRRRPATDPAHDVRHSYATAALAAGIPAKVVSERLGHANIAITLDVYSHVIPGMDAQAANAVAGLILDGSSPSEGPGPKPGPSTDKGLTTATSGCPFERR